MATPLRTVLIVSSPNILNGKPCIEDRRISVQQVVEYHIYEGWSIEKLEAVLGLRPAEVYAALTYYFDHRAEIDKDIRDEAEAFDEPDESIDPQQFLNVLDDYLSIKQAAKQLGISERRVRQLCDEGRIPARKVGINWLIHPSALTLNEVQNRKPGRPSGR